MDSWDEAAAKRLEKKNIDSTKDECVKCGGETAGGPGGEVDHERRGNDGDHN